MTDSSANALTNALALEAGANAYLAFWSGLTPLTLDRLETVTTDEVHFKDPFNDVVGREGFRAVLAHMFENTKTPTTTILHWGWGGPTVVLARWRFSAVIPVLGNWRVEGMSDIRLGPDGRVVSHMDHYDAAEQVYARLPGLGGLLGLSRRRMSATVRPGRISKR
ncbi:MAG: nuclear transport factor 2 family protein [Rhodospirillum sp.]|nr:nuclear transport factor 2 family protein [Rhodospirillum sp.]MCF8492143.1 nuclear transport factor 2 family protein [Rhodospirillum sp.]MCF8502600.1 nuclear transport factor 2 family protein [Rhodospirillum sp.]